MAGPEGADFDGYLSDGLRLLGLEASETDTAIMRVAHSLYWPATVELLALDLANIGPEPDQDLSRAPSPEEPGP